MFIPMVAAALAALVHVYIFVLESLLWTTPRARAVFGTGSEQEARDTRLLALQQGFYNLFLAVVAGVGAIALAAGGRTVGVTLVAAGTGSMLGAAVVLALSMPQLRRAAAVQGLFPAVALVALVLDLSV